MLTASCLCGDIRLRIDAKPGPVTACHCRQCRKITGHHSAAVPVPWALVEVTGQITWFDSSPAARRGFCGRCGSYLIREGYDGLAYVFTGAIDGATGLRMDGHIFYADKGDYYRVGEVLRCYATGRSGPEIAP
ncbi:MAG: GFA family protein [Rhodobacteraceae bacterium]|nr:GFA family protein [Paracoccaceae bacterium]